jgi:hypothetical protein
MKLVIQTQIKENYGAHDWDGKGACPQYWKFKGGNTFVVENITPAQAEKINDGGIPTLKGLIEHFSESWQEYILGWDLEDDGAKVCDEWESPIILHYADGAWQAREVNENGEYGYFRKEIVRQIRTWTMQAEGEQTNNTCVYDMEDGTTVPYSGLAEWMDQKEAA